MQYDENTYVLFAVYAEATDTEIINSQPVQGGRNIKLSDLPADAYVFQFFQKEYVPRRGWKKVNLSPKVFINGTIMTEEELLAQVPFNSKIYKELAEDDEKMAIRTRAGHVVVGHINDLIIHI